MANSLSSLYILVPDIIPFLCSSCYQGVPNTLKLCSSLLSFSSFYLSVAFPPPLLAYPNVFSACLSICLSGSLSFSFSITLSFLGFSLSFMFLPSHFWCVSHMMKLRPRVGGVCLASPALFFCIHSLKRNVVGMKSKKKRNTPDQDKLWPTDLHAYALPPSCVLVNRLT